MKNSWRIKKVAELVEIRVSNVDKVIFPGERKVRLCNYMDAYKNSYLSNDTQYSIGSVNLNEFSRFSLLYDDVIITKDSETPEDIAVSSVVVEDLDDVVCGYHLAILRPVKNEVFGQFLMHKLQHAPVQKLFYRIASGSTRYGLTISSIENICLSIPSLSRQRKIAKILSTCDSVIGKTEAAITKYQSIKQGMMHDLFTRGIGLNTGRIRAKYQDAPELYVESELGVIPKGWRADELKNLTSLITDGSHFSPKPQDKGLPIGNVKDMNPNGFNYESCTKILPEVFELLVKQNCSPKEFDVLLSKDGTIGRVIHFTDSKPIVLLSSIAILRVNEQISSRFLAQALQSEYFGKELYKLLSGSALKRITLKDIQKIRIPYSSSIEEQELIASKLEAINRQLQNEQAALAKYKQAKAGLMHDLLTGKVEVEAEAEALQTL